MSRLASAVRRVLIDPEIRQRTTLVLFAAVLATAAAPASAVTLDWATVVWNDGDLTNTYTLDGVDVTITYSTAAAGTLSPTGFPDTPYEDGPPPASDDNFGCCLDLGVIFDPDAGEGQSPIVVTVEFTDPGTLAPVDVTGLTFEISDIDFSAFGDQDSRVDQVVVTSNAGDPTLTAKTGTPSFAIAPGNTATSDGSTEVFPPSDDGTVIADFGATPVNTVTITYNEASGNDNPGFRGIGMFFDFQFEPPPGVPIPTLGEWGLIALALTLALGGLWLVGRGSLFAP